MVGLKKAAVSFALATMIAAGGLGAAMFVPVRADEAPAKEVAPIALYEFKDAGNFGKDSMGNYDMKYRNEYLEGGTGPVRSSRAAGWSSTENSSFRRIRPRTCSLTSPRLPSPLKSKRM